MLNLNASARPGTVAASIHEGGVLLFHMPSGTLFTANQVGARIWQHLERDTPPAAIAESLSREYRIAFETAMTSTTRFLAELVENDLIDASKVQ